MALDASACANALNNAYEAYKANVRGNFLDTFNNIIDVHSQMAVPSMQNVVILTAASTLDITMKKPKEETLEIATKYMAYWAATILPIGIPNTLPMGGTITTVSNDAMSFINPCKSDLDDLANSSNKGDPYLKFMEILFGYAKKITWTVIEVTPPPAAGTHTFQVNIS